MTSLLANAWLEAPLPLPARLLPLPYLLVFGLSGAPLFDHFHLTPWPPASLLPVLLAAAFLTGYWTGAQRRRLRLAYRVHHTSSATGGAR